MRAGRQPTPDKKRDLVIKLLERGFSIREIQYATGLSETTVNNIKKLYAAVRDEDWATTKEMVERYHLVDNLRWALKYTGKTMPEEEKKEEVKKDVVEEKPVEVLPTSIINVER